MAFQSPGDTLPLFQRYFVFFVLLARKSRYFNPRQQKRLSRRIRKLGEANSVEDGKVISNLPNSSDEFGHPPKCCDMKLLPELESKYMEDKAVKS